MHTKRHQIKAKRQKKPFDDLYEHKSGVSIETVAIIPMYMWMRPAKSIVSLILNTEITSTVKVVFLLTDGVG